METIKTTYAQEAIKRRIRDKNDLWESFQDYTEHYDYEAYVDYSESSHSCDYD